MAASAICIVTLGYFLCVFMECLRLATVRSFWDWCDVDKQINTSSFPAVQLAIMTPGLASVALLYVLVKFCVI